MLCDFRGHFLFEVRPDVFPQGYLTETELALWAMYYKNKNTKGG